MSLTKADKLRLEKLLLDVGFEGQRLQNPADYIPHELKINVPDEPVSPGSSVSESIAPVKEALEPKQEAELDDDIMALLDDSSEAMDDSGSNAPAETDFAIATIDDQAQTNTESAPVGSLNDIDMDVEEDFDAFLDDSPSSSASSAVQRRLKATKSPETIITVPNNTIAKDLTFNLTLTEQRLETIFNQIAELETVSASEESYLEDKAKGSSRLASRAFKPKEEADVVENNSIPKNIIFNLELPDDRLTQISKMIGETSLVAESKKAESSYLDEEKSKLSSRIASRLKQKDETVVPVENNTVPEESRLRFNKSLAEQRLEEIAKNIGNISKPGLTDTRAAFLEEKQKVSRLKTQKQETVEVIADNPTLPKKLRFNFVIDPKKFQNIIRSIGE